MRHYGRHAGTGIGGVIGSNQNHADAANLANYGDVLGYTQVDEEEIVLTRQEQVEKDFLNEFLFSEDNN